MSAHTTRRTVLGAAGIAALTGAAARPAAAQDTKSGAVKIIGVCCSPRKGMTTAASLGIALAAAKEAGDTVSTELIELADMDIPVFDPATGPAKDFMSLVPRLAAPEVGGIIVGTPVYFCNMTSLCKAFLDNCIAFRKNKLALSGKVAGVLAVGGCRNGGQELALRSVSAALLCQEMIVVGDGRPTAHIGATLWSSGNSIEKDDFGQTTAKNLGRRVAEIALQQAG